nr:right-handed parallel beta-helix repeat-containing protein [uncultured Cohaesibacter sp.]
MMIGLIRTTAFILAAMAPALLPGEGISARAEQGLLRALPDPLGDVTELKQQLALAPDLDIYALSNSVSQIMPSLTPEVWGQDRDDVTASPLEGVKKTARKQRLDFLPMDLVLGQVRKQMGSKHHADLRLANPRAGQPVLTLQSGAFTLSDIHAALEKAGNSEALTKSDSVYSLHYPLFIMSAAKLQIEAGETLTLSTTEGVFIVNIGNFSMHKAELKGSEQRNKVKDFKPFILTALGGGTDIVGSKLSNLGFGDRTYMRGIDVVSNLLFPIQTQMRLLSNRIVDVGSIEMIGMKQIDIRNNLVINSRDSALRIRNVENGQVQNNIIVGSQHHGIHLTQNPKNLMISGNVISSGQGAGIYASGGVSKAHILNNLLLDNAQDGIALEGAACSEITGNSIYQNGKGGIATTNSLAMHFQKNIIAGNSGAAIAIIGGIATEDRHHLNQNRFIDNEIGVLARHSPKLELTGNDFSRQLPVLFSGELKRNLPQYLARAGKLDNGVSDIFTTTSSTAAAVGNGGARQFVLLNLESCKL